MDLKLHICFLNCYLMSYQALTPYEFVEGMKKKGIRVPGIGHRYKLFIECNTLNSMNVLL